MTLEFKGYDIFFFESETCNPLMGYFEPNGEFINFSKLLDVPCHDGDETIPPVYEFLKWVSYLIRETDYRTFGNNNNRDYLKYPGINEVVKRGYEYKYGYDTCSLDEFKEQLNIELEKLKNSIIENSHQKDRYYLFDKWRYNLLLFFQKAYSKKPFFEAINRQIKVDNLNDIKNSLCDYGFYIKRMILNDHFKDICVQYLGYDSLERFRPNGMMIEKHGSMYYYDDIINFFNSNPRIITSSYPNINERYYNYLLMDWVVHKLPRYRFNEQTGIYEKQPEYLDFHYNDRERIFEEEIKNIKKIVPLSDRHKYFR